MRQKILLKWSLVALGVTGIALFSVIVFFWKSFHEETFSFVADQIPWNLQQSKVGPPARLKIPEINIDAAIEYVGLTPQGAMAVPAGPADVAWFRLGPRPGESGSAVIAGHEGWKDGIRAVFDNLYQLRAGDEVYVTDQQGAATTFMVSGVRTYDQNGDALSVFSSSDGKAHLNLITCEGIWNAAEKSYSDRLVVFTDKE